MRNPHSHTGIVFPRQDRPQRARANVGLRFIVPCTVRETEPLSPAACGRRAAFVAGFLNREFKGSTRYRAFGSDPHNPRGEPVHVIETYTTHQKWRGSQRRVRSFIRDRRRKWTQGSIAFQFEDELGFF